MSKRDNFYLLTSAASLSIASILMTGLWRAARIDGWHSTPAIWLAFLNFPGCLFLIHSEQSASYCFAVLTNAALYLLILKLVQTVNKSG